MTFDWRTYLDEFHARRAGSVGHVLQRCEAGGLTPYDWVVRPVVGRNRRVLDLACGSGAVLAQLAAEQTGSSSTAAEAPHPCAVGVDRSLPEVRLSRRLPDAPAVCADATALPFGPATFDAIVCSMGLMVLPLPAALGECARVLRSGGMLAATVASPRPLRPSDILVLGPLTARLRTPPQFPGGGELTGLGPALDAAGFDLIEDARERFVFRVCHRSDADLLLSALYLPDVPAERRDAALDWLADRAHARPAGVDVAVPVRRVLALRR